MKNTKLQQTVTINLSSFELFYRPSPLSLYELKEHTDNKILTHLMQLYFIELPKQGSTICLPESMQNWVTFFNATTSAEIDQIATKSEAIEEASNMLKYISQDPVERERFEARRKALMDEKDRLEWAEENGKRTVAINMIKEDFALELIAKITGLSIDVLKELQHQQQP